MQYGKKHEIFSRESENLGMVETAKAKDVQIKKFLCDAAKEMVNESEGGGDPETYIVQKNVNKREISDKLVVVEGGDNLNRSLARQRRQEKRKAIPEDENEFLTLRSGTLHAPKQTISEEEIHEKEESINKLGVLAGEQTLSR